MKLLTACVIATILFCGCRVPWVIRAYARSMADHITYAHRPSTVKQLIRCISILSWSNKWITSHTEQDEKRIDRVRVMLDEMLHPHD